LSTGSTLTYRIHIHATSEEIWDALTTRGEEYGYRARVEYDLKPGGAYRGLANEGMREHGMPEVAVDGEVLEVEAPRRLVHTWNPLFGGPIDEESPARLTWELEEGPNGVTKLTLTREAEGAPMTAGITSGEIADAGGGFPFVLSDLKTLLETGKALPVWDM
jgi:uncharacterized protein YndB with AHSA1/START domain